MRRILACGAVALVPIVGAAVAQEVKAPTHTLVAAADLNWGEPPPVFEKGMSFTVLSGDPGQAGTFVVRLKMPAGYEIAPHTHPTDEHVTVLSGTLALGMGDTLERAATKNLPAGGYALLPADMRHFAIATTAVVVQVSGAGPFALTYVNPADDPTKRAARK
jgi:quercetin dioxygenase-like cupin family protein